jgi:hypothetical protein
MPREPTAAEALYGHLPRQQEYVVKQDDRRETLAQKMYRRPKPAPLNPYRESLLRCLKEANARVREGNR